MKARRLALQQGALQRMLSVRVGGGAGGGGDAMAPAELAQAMHRARALAAGAPGLGCSTPVAVRAVAAVVGIPSPPCPMACHAPSHGVPCPFPMPLPMACHAPSHGSHGMPCPSPCPFPWFPWRAPPHAVEPRGAHRHAAHLMQVRTSHAWNAWRSLTAQQRHHRQQVTEFAPCRSTALQSCVPCPTCVMPTCVMSHVCSFLFVPCPYIP